MDVSKAKPAQVQAAQALKRTDESQQTQRREAQAKEQAPKKAEEPKRPVVNAQGQTTGRLLNVSA